jgi:hypothetical protein
MYSKKQTIKNRKGQYSLRIMIYSSKKIQIFQGRKEPKSMTSMNQFILIHKYVCEKWHTRRSAGELRTESCQETEA